MARYEAVRCRGMTDHTHPSTSQTKKPTLRTHSGVDAKRMPHASHHVSFCMGPGRYALSLHAVGKVVPIVEISRLPKAPAIVSGVVNVAGRIVPVINVRRRFGLPERELILTDRMIIARTTARRVALVVDEVTGVIQCPEDRFMPSAQILPGMEYIKGIATLDDGMVLIHDLELFLSLEEERSLASAMKDL